jgi:MtfA peptidase
MNWLRKVAQALQVAPPEIPQVLWQDTLRHYPFLAALTPPEQARLRTFSALFLSQKKFHGVGLEITDAVGLAIAAQACLPVLHLHANPARALAWYDDFVGINVYPGEMRARRKAQDAAGVMHHYSEDLRGEAMDNGPVTLSWADVQSAGHTAAEGYNVVVHEFAHKLDMHSGAADGCPQLPSRSMYARWQAVMAAEYQAFCDAAQLSERFGAAPPYLDAYAATNPGEFFAVASEAYFVNRAALQNAHPALLSLFDGFYLQAKN